MLLVPGDVFLLKEKYRTTGSVGLGIIIKIDQHAGANFVCYDYVAMLENGQLIRITETCVEEIYTVINQQTIE